jgi:hypothetical protein
MPPIRSIGRINTPNTHAGFAQESLARLPIQEASELPHRPAVRGNSSRSTRDSLGRLFALERQTWIKVRRTQCGQQACDSADEGEQRDGQAEHRRIQRRGVEQQPCAGICLGLVGAWALTRVMESLLFGISTPDLATFAAAPVILVATAALASYVPARRAMRVDPVVALRDE